MVNFNLIGSAFNDFGAAANDLFSAQASEITAQGDWQASVDYLKAKQIAEQNEAIAQTSGDIQVMQQNRKNSMAIGTQEATVAGNNLEGGSAGDLLRMSLQQGALAKAVIESQTAINVNSYKQSAQAYQTMSDQALAAGNAANAAAAGKENAGIFSGIAGILSLGFAFL